MQEQIKLARQTVNKLCNNEAHIFTIPCRLISLNQYIEAERSNKYAAANMKKKQTSICATYAKLELQNKLKDKRYDIICLWQFSTLGRDPDNVFFAIKFILDGLVNAGIMDDDNCANIGAISHYWEKAKKDAVIVALY